MIQGRIVASMGSAGIACVLLALWFCIALPVAAQTLQKGIDAQAKGSERLRVDYVGYRAARWDSEHITEPQNERPNKGGLIYVYFTNTSDKPLQLAFWRCNGQDESHWRLGGSLAWDRVYSEHLEPGQPGVLEIDAVTEEFGEGQPFTFSYVERSSWGSAGRFEGVLREDPVQIALIRVLPGMKDVEVHVRHVGKGKVTLESLEILGHPGGAVQWVGAQMDGAAHAIARIALDAPLKPSELTIVRVSLKDKQGVRAVYAHRRAFEDRFPIGVWSNTPETYALLRQHHVDTVVRGGRAADEFYAQVAPKYGFHTIAPVERDVDVDVLRSLGDHPAVTCWMLADEPDWSTQPVVMLWADRAARRYNQTKPTFITLCRNVKFFEYAPIADIACQDHYSVTAPSSSRWPKHYGTYLEETAYYTADLKRASEPKPIWVWSQAIADWGERPKHPVPTPNELAAQLLLNLGRGAKGILWFNYDHKVGEKYPDTREAMKRWGRVMSLTRDDFLAAEPFEADVKAPEKVDVAPLVSWDNVLLCVTNLNYEIHPEAYPFAVQKEVEISLRLPEWIAPKCALLIGPDGVKQVPFKGKKDKAKLTLTDLEACQLIVLPNDANAESRYRELYDKVLRDETQTF